MNKSSTDNPPQSDPHPFLQDSSLFTGYAAGTARSRAANHLAKSRSKNYLAHQTRFGATWIRGAVFRN